MPSKMAKEIKKEYDVHAIQSYMLALQPIAATGECGVAIISKQLGYKLQKLIDKHKKP